MKKIFIINCNAKKDSARQAYTDAYIEEAQKSGNEVRCTNIYEFNFDYQKFNGNEIDTSLTDELRQAQENILWADQVVISYPVWWIGLPAKLSSFFERILQLNILVTYGKFGPEPILKNKTMVLLQSYDMPAFAMKYICGDIPARQLQIILGTWCGFKLEKRFDLDMIGKASEKTKQKWMKSIRKFAAKVK